ncbi:zinc finger protein chinmo isoform X2 [Sitodiplosis mosellana]|uniref:zinc finger protein chinmo isoform X2 n=1 Tax=Sitodiplosis mosellana TaxID=263140 RepID=UPI0024452329|nr:zinc finger protein chinmo isoform X2 [Sitodiplosis mosellana]
MTIRTQHILYKFDNMDPQQQFCLKWNSYSSNLAMTFSNLFKSDLLADVTLYCGGTVFKAHKLILAACSKNFADLFESAPPSSSCVVILEATSAENMSALLEFMYKGEVHVSQEALNSFLKAAENLQVKGLSTEHGRLAAAQSQSHEQRPQRNSSSATSPSALPLNSMKQECDSLMNPSSSGLSGGFAPYIPQMYRPFDATRGKERQSVLRDGSRGSAENSGSSKRVRPSSSASSTAPTEADTLQNERTSPQSRYDNHSPPSTTARNGSTDNQDERNGSKSGQDQDDDIKTENDAGAEDLRIKLEADYSPQPPTSNTTPSTPTSLVSYMETKDGLPPTLAQIAPADMLNVWNATKLSSKSGTVNTADGKKLKCLYCDRLYGYETNLRAHIRQRHQGIRVPCPFCSRTFTRNNTVRRHIAREHKHEIAINQIQSAQPNHAA